MPDGDTTRLTDVHARIADRIIATLETGTRPWQKPWNAAHAEGRIVRPLRHNGVPYNGINILMLWSAAADTGYTSPYWLSFRQALECGGNVREGERGTPVVYANRITRAETGDDGEEAERTIPFLKGYTVFNAAQCENLPPHFTAQPSAPPAPLMQRCEAAERFAAATGAVIRHGGNRAYYAEGPDIIQMPPFESFRDPESHASTKLHELVHWTKHEARLARDIGRKRYGDGGYAREELVAEIGAAFLCADLGVTAEPREDHAAYVASWIEALKGDKRLIFAVASHAQRAADYLHGLQPAARPDAA